MKRRTWIVGTAVVLILALGGGFVWYRGRNKTTTAVMDTAPAQRGSLVVTVSDSGTVSGNLQVDVHGEVAGTVSDVRTDLGKQVKKGDVLAVLSAPDVMDAATQARLDLQTAQSRLDQMVHPTSNARQSDIDQAKSRVALAQATLNSRNADAANLTVKAPVGGTVVALNYQEGGSANSGSVFATISDLDHLQFVMAVTDNAVPSVQVGQTASVVIGPGNESRTGTVSAVDQAGYVNNGQTFYNVTITLDGGFSPNVRPDMYGYAIINTIGHGGDHGVEGKGSVQSGQSVDVRFAVSGTIGQLNVRQGQTVQDGDVLAQLSNDSVVTAAQQAQADYQSAVSSLNDLLNPPVTSTQADIEAQQVKVQEAQLALAARQRDVDALTLTSPIDGVVIAESINVGDKIGANGTAALFTVADYSKMQVTVDVDELDIGKVQVGQKASVTVDALPGKSFSGQVVTVAPAGTQQQGVATFPVTLSVDNPGGLKTGMTANVNVLVAEKNDVLLVPIEAVQKRGGRSFVRKMVNGQAMGTEVTTGLANDTEIEITSGLSEGDSVVTGTSSQQAVNMRGIGGVLGGRPPGEYGGGNRTGGSSGGGTGGTSGRSN